MSSNKKFEIPFEGLKNGKHTFEFTITDTFFEELAYSIIKGANAKVVFTLNKKETMLIGQFEIYGEVEKACDRCSDAMQIPIHVSHEVYYKYGEEKSDDENLLIIPSSAHSIDISPLIYELLTVEIPNRTIHREGACNKEMMQEIEKYVNNSSKEKKNYSADSTDPRWNKLKHLK